jgi:hypothetical protein
MWHQDWPKLGLVFDLGLLLIGLRLPTFGLGFLVVGLGLLIVCCVKEWLNQIFLNLLV